MRHKWKQDARSTKNPKWTCVHCRMVKLELQKPRRIEYQTANTTQATAGPCPGK